jgi:steroid delta-isomerase-like uncharacterized protein
VSIEQTQQVMSAYLGALLDRTEFRQFLAPDVVWTTMETGDVVRGRDAVANYITGMHTQIFDAHPQVESLLITESSACLEAVLVGTQIAEFAGIPPTGAQVRVPYCIVYQVTDGMISEMHAYVPIAGLINQLRELASVPAGG